RDRAAVCRAAAWRPCGRESAPKCGFRASAKRSRPGWQQAGNEGGLFESRRIYTGCQSTGKPISQPDWVRCESLIPDAIRGRSAGLKSFLEAWSLIQMDSFEINKVLGAILGTCLVLL